MNRLQKVGLFMEIGGVVGLAVMAFKAECKRHKAVMKMLDTEILNCALDIQHVLDQAKIRNLEEELEALKGEKEEEA